MSERHGYEPGVPCWVDTLQPESDAAGGLLRARLRGRDVAGVGSLRHGEDLQPAWSTYVRRER